MTTIPKLQKRLSSARGDSPADIVFKNANILDVFSGSWIKGDLALSDGLIVGLGESYTGKEEINCSGKWLVPGFIDSHVHIESTMMLPGEFTKAVMPHGTTSIIWDPHEIANVFGLPGLNWALTCAEKSAADLFVMLSSCVPSSKFETSGASIPAKDLASLKNHPRALGLAEVMDFPSVVQGQTEILEKITAFHDRPKDGHSPMLRGKDLNAYLTAGIRTCHETCSLEEAQEKLRKGMRILIREGSVAKNAEELVHILSDYSGAHCMICTDDRNPLDIAEEGHLDFILRIAMQQGIRPEVAYRSASLSPALHYGLHEYGALAPGYWGDVVVLNHLEKVEIDSVFKKGQKVDGQNWQWPNDPKPPKENSIHLANPNIEKLCIKATGNKAKVNVIEVIPEQILTNQITAELKVENGIVQPDAKIQKMAVFERHHGTGNVGVGFVKGFALQKGAIASTVAHDAHNIGIVGANDSAIMHALAAIQKLGGGIVAVDDTGKILAELPLPVAGLMSRNSFQEMIPQIQALRNAVKSLGCPLKEPFLQMSFLALPVIPHLKISDLGLVDVIQQKIIPPVIQSS